MIQTPSAAALGAVVAIAGALAGAMPRAQTADPTHLLDLASAYLERYERDMAAIVAEETYVQSTTGLLPRTLNSDFTIVAAPTEGWVEYRDVFAVDGGPVRDRANRVVALFLKPNPDAAAQAKRIAEESARFNLNPRQFRFRRNFNVPLTALRYLRRGNQPRSTWEAGAPQPVGGRPAEVLRFLERTKPPLIGSKDDVPARGTYWIDPKTGAVMRTELRIPGAIVNATIGVNYAEHAALTLWLPETMTEHYRISIAGVTNVEGRATYANFRRFNVDTSISVK